MRTDAKVPQTELPEANRVTIEGGVKIAVYFIAVCVGFIIVYFARALFLPVALSILFTLTLSPLVRFARRRGIPTGISSIAITGSLLIVLVTGLYSVSQPVARWISDAPNIGNQLEERLRSIRSPVEAVKRAEKEVEQITEPSEPDVQKVVVQQPGLLARASDNLAALVGTIVVTFGLTTFLLAYSDVFYEKLMRAIPKLSDKKRALGMIYDTEKEVSRYLFTIAVINCGLGVAIGLSMWLLGMPTPYVWGMVAALLNFLPFLGAIAGVVIIAIVALISLESLSMAFVVPLVYLLLTAIEGHFVTPSTLGQKLELNPVVILLSVALWGFLWGVVGVLIAVPILIVVKTACARIESAKVFSEFLAGPHVTAEPDKKVAEQSA